MTVKKILITGAYGLIGNLVFGHLSRQPERYEVFGLDRYRQPSSRIRPQDVTEIPTDHFYQANLTDPSGTWLAMLGMDMVVSMAAEPGGNNWDSLLQNNLIGAYQMFESAKRAEVKRVVFASSVMVNSGYRADAPYGAIFEGKYDEVPDNFQRVKADQPPRPTTLYAASKVWGETLGAYNAQVFGLSCLCLRIGWVLADDRPPPKYGRSVWCSHRDICQLVEKCLEAPEELKFDIFYGFSDNRYRFADLEHTKEVLGYQPQDSADQYPV
jgi:nucleoside-diphosphate-sugar epimerase